jgi:hypothetical protein
MNTQLSNKENIERELAREEVIMELRICGWFH